MTQITLGITDDGQPFTLPPDLVTQTVTILAKRRAGKSYTASVLAEQLVTAGLPFVVLDPTGAWWGLRASADGTGAGLPVVIIGGAHGDLPLDPATGAAVADLVVDVPGWYVLDLSYTESGAEQDRFALAFASRLFRRKATSPSPLHLFVDEADAFIPQRPQPGQQRMLGAFEALIRRGGIHGIGMTMISQRPAVINKNVLSQIEVLIVLQITAPQDRAAIEEWVRGNATKADSDALLATLASLPRGTAWVWSPAWLDVLARVHVNQRQTYNSSATPTVGTARMLPEHLAAVDLDHVRQALAGAVATSASDDPAVLQQQIAALEQQLRQRPVKRVVERVEVPVLSDADRQALTDYAAQLATTGDQLATLGAQLAQQATVIQTALAQITRAPVARSSAAVGAQHAAAPANGRIPPTRQARDTPAPPLSDRPDAQQRMLAALAAFQALGVPALARQHLAVYSDQSPKSSAYADHLRALKAAGLITLAAGRVALTDAGRQTAPTPPQPATLDALHAAWLTKLPDKAARILQVLIDSYPAGMDRTTLADATGQSPTSSAYAEHLRRLKTLGLIQIDRDQVVATALVFPNAASA